jgi:hypothetical protein
MLMPFRCSAKTYCWQSHYLIGKCLVLRHLKKDKDCWYVKYLTRLRKIEEMLNLRSCQNIFCFKSTQGMYNSNKTKTHPGSSAPRNIRKGSVFCTVEKRQV